MDFSMEQSRRIRRNESKRLKKSLSGYVKIWRAKYKGEKKTKSGAVELIHNPRNYDVLQYIGTAPRTSYLARVKNPNPSMPDAVYRGLATISTG